MFNTEALEVVRNFAKFILGRVGHEHIICSSLKFASWKKLLCVCIGRTNENVGETEVFLVEQTPLFYNCKHGNYLRDTRLLRLLHTNVVERKIHFWCQGLTFFLFAHAFATTNRKTLNWRIADKWIIHPMFHVYCKLDEFFELVSVHSVPRLCFV